MKIVWKQSYTGMPYSNFEDKMKNRLHDVTMQPGAEVWDKIANRLQTEGADESKTAFVLPLFLRKENLKYSLSSAAAVALMVVALNSWAPEQTRETAPVFAEQDVTGLEEIPCEESDANAEQLFVSQQEVQTIADHKPKNKISRISALELLVGHEVQTQPIDPIGLSLAGLPEKISIPPLPPVSVDISNIDVEPLLAVDVRPESGDRMVPTYNKRSKSFKPRLSWGLTAMSALHMNSLSETIQANEFEDNLVGISSLASHFQYPNGLRAARAELEVLLSEKVGIGTGIGVTNSYQSPAFSNVDPDARALQNNNAGNGNVNVDFSSIGQEAMINELSYSSIDIPLFLNYYLKKGKSRFLLSTGLLYKHMMTNGPDLLVETVSYTTNAQSNVRYVDAMDGNFAVKNLMFLIGRAHYQLNLSNAIALHAGPSFNIGTGPAFSYQQTNSRNPFSLGFEVGLRFFPGG